MDPNPPVDLYGFQLNPVYLTLFNRLSNPRSSYFIEDPVLRKKAEDQLWGELIQKSFPNIRLEGA